MTFIPPEVCKKGRVDYVLPGPVVSPNYPTQWLDQGRTRENPTFFKMLARDSQQTRIQDKGIYEDAIERANERLESCKMSLPEGTMKPEMERMP